MLDIYFDERYVKIHSKLDKGELKKFEFTSEYGEIYHVFILREIDHLLREEKYYDLSTAYGYGGPVIKSCVSGKEDELIDAFSIAFNEYCSNNNIVSEFVRFHPILNNAIQFSRIYDVKFVRHTVGTNLDISDDPMQIEFSKSTRKTIRRSLRKGLTYEIIENPTHTFGFEEIYYSTLKRNEATGFYYFDTEYFESCINELKDNLLFIQVKLENKVIAMGMYFKFNNFIHAHLSGSLSEYLDYSPAYILKYALAKWGKENGFSLIHYGGATTNDENDPLLVFKRKFGVNTRFDFHIGHKVYNQKVYDELLELKNIKQDIDYFPAYRSI